MYLVDKLRPKARRGTRIGATALTALTFLLLAVFGARMAWDEYRFEVTSPGLGIPTWIYTMWLPLLSLAIFGRAVGVLIRMRRSKE
jgi:TRAP-type C4-dicarboxylate transport system permease small subunit